MRETNERRRDPHCHIVCTVCGNAVDSPIVYDPEEDISAAQQTGFIISRHSTVFGGICPACQVKNKK